MTVFHLGRASLIASQIPSPVKTIARAPLYNSIARSRTMNFHSSQLSRSSSNARAAPYRKICLYRARKRANIYQKYRIPDFRIPTTSLQTFGHLLLMNIPRVHFLLLTGLLAAMQSTAQDNYEIQVYASQTVGKDTTMVE